MLSIIVAYAMNHAIGKNNQLLWHIPADLKFFRKMTEGKIVIMGRKTYESIPENFRPLPNRKTFVLTRDPSYTVDHPDVQVFTDVEKCLMVAQLTNEEVMIAGGAQIYEMTLPYVDRIYATIINESFEEADAYFPEIDLEQWEVTYEGAFASEQLELFYTHMHYKRRHKKDAPKGV